MGGGGGGLADVAFRQITPASSNERSESDWRMHPRLSVSTREAGGQGQQWRQ